MLQFNTINDVQLRFATPVLHKFWPQAEIHNAPLRGLILEKRRLSGSVAISNRGGWQSRDDLLNWGGQDVAALTQWIQACVFQVYETYHQGTFGAYLKTSGVNLRMRATAWANINGKGHWNATHNHHSSHWSGVYYVQVPPGSGQLALLDPRPNINMMDTGNPMLDLFQQSPREIEPKEGLTVIFPSWMQHHVATHEADEERISIAFNLRFICE